MDAAHLSDVRIWPSCISWGRRCICIHGTEQVDTARAHISRTQRGFLVQLPLNPQAVLHGVRNMGDRIEYNYASRNPFQETRRHRVRRIVDDKSQKIYSVEMQ